MKNMTLTTPPAAKKLTREIEKYDWVDALRGYAILMVMMSHSAHPFFGDVPRTGITYSGNYGVMLFFIASSFTLFSSYRKRKLIDGQDTTRFFFIRRIFRIAPLYWLACLAYIVYGTYFHSIWLPPTPFDYTNILANVFFINGLYLSAINYIPPGGWTIGDEMLFYLITPFLFLFIKNLRQACILVISTVIASIAVQLIVHYIIANYTSHPWVIHRDWVFYFWLPNQFPVFCSGILLLYFIEKNSIKYQEWMLVTIMAIFFLLSIVQFDLKFPYFLIQPEYIYTAVLFCFAWCISKTRVNMMIKPINKLGTVSFSAYLIHPVLVELGLWLTSRASGIIELNEHVNFMVVFLFTIFTTYVLSKWTYKHIEKRGIRLGEQLIDKIRQRSSIQSAGPGVPIVAKS